MDERMLRLALMEANLERFRDVLEGADRDWSWSARYLRSRMRLLATPSAGRSGWPVRCGGGRPGRRPAWPWHAW